MSTRCIPVNGGPIPVLIFFLKTEPIFQYVIETQPKIKMHMYRKITLSNMYDVHVASYATFLMKSFILTVYIIRIIVLHLYTHICVMEVSVGVLF